VSADLAAPAPALKFPDGFQQRWLWIDPLAPDPAAYCGAVLRAEEIVRYVKEFNLLIDNDPASYTEKNLKGASYTMSPHPDEGWIIGQDGEHTRLLVQESSRGRYYAVPRNSLVYIRLRETLRLPFYVIGRHNLKIDYVYQGLLLGTGPQVDPGYIGQIYIPLHNLTDQPVEIYLNESFVSIDFVRTGPLALEHGIPETYTDFHKLYEWSKRPIDLEKVVKKTNLHAYLQGSRPSSSLAGLVARFDKLESDFATKTAKMDTEFDKRRYVELAVVGFFVTLLAAFFITSTGSSVKRRPTLPRVSWKRREMLSDCEATPCAAWRKARMGR
jgi:deoxycytidine triphosphate deaminase